MSTRGWITNLSQPMNFLTRTNNPRQFLRIKILKKTMGLGRLIGAVQSTLKRFLVSSRGIHNVNGILQTPRRVKIVHLNVNDILSETNCKTSRASSSLGILS